MLLTKRFKQKDEITDSKQHHAQSVFPRLYASGDSRHQHSLEKAAASSKNKRMILRVSPSSKHFPEDFFGLAHEHSLPKRHCMNSTNCLSFMKDPIAMRPATKIFRMLQPMIERPNTDPLVKKAESIKMPLHKLFERPGKRSKKEQAKIDDKENEVFELTFSLNKVKSDQANQGQLGELARSPHIPKLRKQSAQRLKYRLV